MDISITDETHYYDSHCFRCNKEREFGEKFVTFYPLGISLCIPCNEIRKDLAVKQEHEAEEGEVG